jgi:hypothetical protein
MSNCEDQTELHLAKRRRWALAASAVVASVTMGAMVAACVVPNATPESADRNSLAWTADASAPWEAASPLGQIVSWQNPLRDQQRVQPGNVPAGKGQPGKAMKRPSAPRPQTGQQPGQQPSPGRPAPQVAQKEAGKPQPAKTADSPKTNDVKGADAARVEPPLFDKWPKPRVALFITGDQHGYIEPCGCTGLENQKGGMARRHTFLKQLRDERGWNVLPMDVGNQVQRVNRQSEIKFQVSSSALRKMGYVAIGLGSDDLRMSSQAIIQELANHSGEPDYVSANAVVFDEGLSQRFRVFTVDGTKVGVTQVIGDEFFKRVADTPEITLTPSAKALTSAVAAMKKQGVHYVVAMYHGDPDGAKKLVKAVPGVNLLVVGGSPGEPAYELEKIEGSSTRYVHVGQKGMKVAVIGLFADAKTPVRYQRVELTSEYSDSKEMIDLLGTYQEQLKDAGLRGLDIKPLIHATGNTFVGTDACKDCHTKAYEVWAKSPHAHATTSIQSPPPPRDAVARHFDPECLSCHVTGWEPQKQLPFSSGYLGVEQTPKMLQSGCENCHGPGSAHVDAETNGGAPDLQKKLRESMRLTLANDAAETHCKQCHDLDNSPDFHAAGAFLEYWKRIEHVGKD